MIVAVLVWGASIALFGVAHWLPLALLLLAVAGWADVVSAVFRNTIIQFAGPALRDHIFRHIKDVLKPGGLVILEGYRPEQLRYKTGGPSRLENLYTADLLRAAFADLEILHLAEHDSVISEGSGHGGPSALIDLVARKPAAA